MCEILFGKTLRLRLEFDNTTIVRKTKKKVLSCTLYA